MTVKTIKGSPRVLKNCFIKDLKHKSIIRLLYCPTENMLADMMTKSLTTVELENCDEEKLIKSFTRL